MQQNKDLLEFVFGIAESSQISIQHLARITTDFGMGEMLGQMIGDYESIHQRAADRLAQSGAKARQSGELARLTSYFAAGLQTLFDQSPARIAEVLVNGSAAGIIDLAAAVRKYSDVDADVRDMATDLIELEQRNIQRAVKFLLVH